MFAHDDLGLCADAVTGHRLADGVLERGERAVDYATARRQRFICTMSGCDSLGGDGRDARPLMTALRGSASATPPPIPRTAAISA